MNDDQQKEYEEHYSPDGEYIQYQMENPEMNDQKSKSKQDILNAFTKQIEKTFDYVNPAVSSKQQLEAWNEKLSDWLLNTLTEFERDLIKEVENMSAEYGSHNGEQYTEQALWIDLEDWEKFKLEKEKHPSK